MDKDTKLFKNTTLADVFKDIYANSKKKERQLNLLIADLKPLVKTIEDAIVIIPLITDYLQLSVKNDDHLIKLAAIIQRLITTNDPSGENDMTLSDAELENIKAELEKLGKENEIIKSERETIAGDA